MRRSHSAPTQSSSTGPEDDLARPPEVERAYFTRRATDHRQLADTADTESGRALHLRFAQAYQERAEAIDLVDQD